jgi:hypothetical protein
MNIIIIGVFAFGIFASSIAFSQENTKQKVNTFSENLSIELNLDDRQKNLVKEINLANFYKTEEINLNPDLSNEQKQEQISINNKKTQARIREILNSEQQEKFNKFDYSK